MDVVIGIDTRTTATKAVAADLDAELRGQASVHYPLSVPGPGRAELDPEQLRKATAPVPKYASRVASSGSAPPRACSSGKFPPSLFLRRRQLTAYAVGIY